MVKIALLTAGPFAEEPEITKDKGGGCVTCQEGLEALDISVSDDFGDFGNFESEKNGISVDEISQQTGRMALNLFNKEVRDSGKHF